MQDFHLKLISHMTIGFVTLTLQLNWLITISTKFQLSKIPRYNTFYKCIWDYRSAINYKKAYSATAYEYLLKSFYRRINKKKYKSQILKHNIHYTNVIIMQNVIFIVKICICSAKNTRLLLIRLMQRLRGYAIQQMCCCIIIGIFILSIIKHLKIWDWKALRNIRDVWLK